MPRPVMEKLAAVQMLEVSVPATEGRELLLIRCTETSDEFTLLCGRWIWTQSACGRSWRVEHRRPGPRELNYLRREGGAYGGNAHLSVICSD